MTIYKINTEADLMNAIDSVNPKKNRCIKVRVYENGKSYEDYSISYTLQDRAIYNFTVTVEHGYLVVSKRARTSTRHVMFEAGCNIDVTRVNSSTPYIALNVLSEVRYTDGSHRYER